MTQISRKVRIGQIGCGEHGLGVLAAQMPSIEGADLIAAAAVDEVAAGRAVEEYGFERPYLDYHRMLAQEDLDAVVVVTPHHLLKDAALAAIKSGAHVFIEKPMAVNRQEGQEIVDAAKSAGVTLMVGYCQRFAESRRLVKSLIERGAIGDIVSVNASKCCWPLSGWPADPEKGGGRLRYIGVHATDQVLWLVGAEVERVYGEIVWHPATGADRRAAYTVRFKDGVLANVLCTQDADRLIDSVEVIGTAGRISADWPSDVVQVQSSVLEEYRQPTAVRPNGDLFTAMYRDEMQAWVDTLRDRKEPPITGEDGVRVLEVIDAVYQSGRTFLPVTLS